MMRMLGVGVAVGLATALVAQSSLREASARGGGSYRMSTPPVVTPGTANPRFIGQQKPQRLLLPAVQKIRDAAGGRGGGGTRPKPKEDCMSCAD
jgi:hypothetical protein